MSVVEVYRTFPLAGKVSPGWATDGGTGGSLSSKNTAATPTPNPAPPRDRTASPFAFESPAATRPVGGGESIEA